MTVLARAHVISGRRPPPDSFPELADQLVFQHYMRDGYVPDHIKDIQALAHQWAHVIGLRQDLKELLAYRRNQLMRWAAQHKQSTTAEADGGQRTNDGDNDADDGGTDSTPVNDAISKLEATADKNKTSKGQCARAVREALAEGGIEITPPAPQPGNRAASAADYGPSFEKAGADLVASADRSNGPAPYPPADYTPKKGDVIVFDRFPNHPDGHTAMYNGDQWISDFRQATVWPNQSEAKNYGPSYSIYRFRQFDN